MTGLQEVCQNECYMPSYKVNLVNLVIVEA